MDRTKITVFMLVLLCGVLGVLVAAAPVSAVPPDKSIYDAYPPFMSNNPPPLVMLVMGRNHKLFYEAYNDASDLNQDGVLDTTYKPDEIDYYGYFDSFKYYEYVGTGVDGQFEPVGAGIGSNGKMKPAGNYWSGDFLNYLTMSRMDCMRKVLYGGYRVVDTATETVLERAYIPQDAHSWGKEYESITRDGYDIYDYTPLLEPQATPVQLRHMFASTSLYERTNTNYRPLLRVLPNNPHRIWEWVAKESPVADNSLETGGSGTWMAVPGSTTAGISGVTRSFYDFTGGYHPADNAEFDSIVSTFATAGNHQGTDNVTEINGSGDPFDADGNYYLTIFNGTLNIPTTDTYTFSVDGDDAVEFLIDLNSDGDFDDSGEVVVGWYGGHGECGCNSYDGSITLSAGSYAFQFRHEELSGSDSYYLRWNLGTPASTITDYRVRVKVADAALPEATNTKLYPNGNYKPTGLLQRHGEANTMYFGLLTGSYNKNMSGGVLRKNITSFQDEIDPDTGVFTSVNGIVGTLDRIRITEYRYASHSYDTGWVTGRPMAETEFPDWGNPLAEMMYETLRYFGGESGPLPQFRSSTMPEDDALGLPNESWVNPYSWSAYCSKPFILAISDIYPTYDSDYLPGSEFGSVGSSSVGAGGTLDVSNIGDLIFSQELASGDRFIGESAATSDGACTAKSVNGFSDIRGLCPEEPTKQGSYYSAAVSYYGHTEDISSAQEDQKVRTYAVGLASPLPKIEIPIQGQIVRLVPFAKSVANYGIVSTGAFQPTNTIVDFFVETISDHYGRFRINYEDVEQGADHDMDAIVIYEYQLIDNNGNPVTAANINDAVAVNITLTSEYASGSIIQHCGYIISGTTRDGTYLEVKDYDTGSGADYDYRLDTPPGVWSGDSGWNDGVDLPLQTTRTFSVSPTGGVSAASILPNPLWYAAKWGAFEDQNNNGVPDNQDEWDKDGDDVPDTYYYVVNPLKLEQQLNKSFADILANTSSGTAAAVVANNSEGQGTMIQAFFKPSVVTQDNKELSWLGYLKSLWVDQFGNLREDTNQDFQFNFDTDRIVEYGTDGNGNVYVRRYTNHYHYDAANQYDANCVLTNCTTSYDTIGIEEIETLFAAGEMLHQRAASDRKIFTFLDGDGLDNDGDGDIDESGEIQGVKIVGEVSSPYGDTFDDTTGELVVFDTSVASRLKPFLGLLDDTAFSYLETGATPDHDTRVDNLIHYIRGVDSDGLTGNPPTRNRTFDNNVWKLGDIVRSTPVSISGALETYDLVYSDLTYLDYIRKYVDRETVVYTGGNDGMLHAFSHGRYVFDENTNLYGYEVVDGDPIGSEIWAYIPQALLPHLKWLADPNYGHSFYVDSKPKVFDARIFQEDDEHPNGWGTVLLVGLGAGGKRVWAEGDFDGNTSTADVYRYFNPTYVCMDITNPRKPRLLWERSYENLGMTTSFPAVVQVGAEYDSSNYTWQNGSWYVVFGSGAHDASGKTDYSGYSDQNGYIFVVDIRTGELLRRFDTNLPEAVMATAASLDKGSDDGSGPVKGLTYNVDAIYIGGASYDSGTSMWSGSMFKINTRFTDTVPEVDPDDWSLSTLFDSDRAITAAPAISVDSLDNVWVYFGTGRFEEMADRVTTEQNYLYGIKDPYFNKHYDSSNGLDYNGRGDYYQNNGTTLSPLTRSELFYANPYVSYDTTGAIDVLAGGLPRITSWDALLGAVRNTEDQGTYSDYFDGWYRALDPTPVGAPSERIISKPAILSGIVFTPVYVPDDDICGFGGSTDTYGVYYETGTAFWRHIFNADTAAEGSAVAYRMGTMLNTGPPPPTVSISIGRLTGAKLFLQTGTGPILGLDVKIPSVKSDVHYWEEE